MNRKALIFGVWALAAHPIQTRAQQAASLPPAGSVQTIPGGQAERGADSMIPPITPGMIKALGNRLGENKRAQEEVMTQYAAPDSRRVVVSFTPGQPTPIIQVVKGYPTAVSFFDTTGEPWPIAWDTNSNPAGASGGVNCNSNSSGNGAAIATVGFYVCTPVQGSNVLQITPASLSPRGGLLVNLQGAPKPFSFVLIGGGSRYDADLSVQVSSKGPKAKTPIAQAAAPDTASPFLTALLDGVAPAEATPLSVSGVSPDDLRAWRVGDRIILRTRYTLVSPEWTASESAEGGLTVYAIPQTPVVLLSAEGRTVSASLAE
jgi:intracellular multiplication protein IcmK